VRRRSRTPRWARALVAAGAPYMRRPAIEQSWLDWRPAAVGAYRLAVVVVVVVAVVTHRVRGHHRDERAPPLLAGEA
jgi:hypothetical protein